jgi:hypothetical protein
MARRRRRRPVPAEPVGASSVVTSRQRTLRCVRCSLAAPLWPGGQGELITAERWHCRPSGPQLPQDLGRDLLKVAGRAQVRWLGGRPSGTRRWSGASAPSPSTPAAWRRRSTCRASALVSLAGNGSISSHSLRARSASATSPPPCTTSAESARGETADRVPAPSPSAGEALMALTRARPLSLDSSECGRTTRRRAEHGPPPRWGPPTIRTSARRSDEQDALPSPPPGDPLGRSLDFTIPLSGG